MLPFFYLFVAIALNVGFWWFLFELLNKFIHIYIMLYFVFHVFILILYMTSFGNFFLFFWDFMGRYSEGKKHHYRWQSLPYDLQKLGSIFFVFGAPWLAADLNDNHTELLRLEWPNRFLLSGNWLFFSFVFIKPICAGSIFVPKLGKVNCWKWVWLQPRTPATIRRYSTLKYWLLTCTKNTSSVI